MAYSASLELMVYSRKLYIPHAEGGFKRILHGAILYTHRCHTAVYIARLSILVVILLYTRIA